MNTRIIIALLLVTGSIPFLATPMASAKHFSVGGEETVLVSPGENDDNPSVPPEGDLFQAATRTQEADGDDCFRPTGDLDKAQDEAQRSLEAEAACGLLVYNEGTTFQQTSDPDQTYHAVTTELRFDAVYTTTVSSYGGISYCAPWCPAFPGRALYDAFHDNASQVGLTEDSDEADYDKNGDYNANVYLNVPHATLAASQASGMYENNGWLFPVYDETIVAFLEERDPTTGEMVSVGPDRLEQIVAAEKADGTLDPRATSEVCLYSADQKITTGAADVSSCETSFEYIAEPERDDNGPVYQGPYSSRCASPTYACGEAFGPYWQAQVVCSFGASICIDHDKVDLVAVAAFERDGYDTTRDYDVWHYAVAPVQSACNGDQEPGFLFESSEGSPYLAHDLDVYEPAASPVGGDQAMPIEEWERAFYDENQPGELLRNSLFPVPVRTLGNDADPTSTFDDYSKATRVEPNAPGDTTQQDVVVPRNLEDDPCIKLTQEDVFGDKPREVEHTTDPWVNVVSNDVTRDEVGDAAGIGLYGTDASHQDADNRPGPATFFTSGFVGMFTDRNDDGDYDQADASEALTEIQRVGAYPMYYDMWATLDDSGEPQVDTERGCTWSDDKGTLPAVMASAGYGPRTGLIQAVLINEPTALVNDDTSDVFEFPGQGPKVFLFATQAIHALSGDSLATLGDGGDSTVEAQVQALIDRLPVDRTQAEIIAANELGLSAEQPSDFGEQCGTDTGGYSSAWSFLHDCNGFDCSGDTIATAYTFELTSSTIGEGGKGIPFFQADGSTNYEFGTGQHTWFDVDPFDNDPTRNFVEDAAPCSAFSNLFDGDDFGNRTECPDETTGLQVTASSGEVSLSWDPTDGADGYIVKRVEGQGDAKTITRTTVTGTSYTDTSVTSGTSYTYSVGAFYEYQNIDLPDRPGPFTPPQTVTPS